MRHPCIRSNSTICNTESHKSSECPQTLIIAHRGASGLRPAHSTDGYRLAADQGADYIECDVAITKDGVLLCLHEAYLSSVTNIESLPEFENKRRSLDYENKKKLDDWWVTDFTWEELQQLRLIQERSYRDQSFNLKYKIATFAEYLNIAKGIFLFLNFLSRVTLKMNYLKKY